MSGAVPFDKNGVWAYGVCVTSPEVHGIVADVSLHAMCLSYAQ